MKTLNDFLITNRRHRLKPILEMVTPKPRTRLFEGGDDDEELVSNLSTLKKKQYDKAKEDAKKQGLTNTNGRYWGKNGKSTHKIDIDSLSLKPLDSEEKKSSNQKQPSSSKPQTTQNKQKSTAPRGKNQGSSSAKPFDLKTALRLLQKDFNTASNGKVKVSQTIEDSDPTIIQAMQFGYRKDVKGWQPAPGTNTSLVNEVFSQVAVSMVMNLESKGMGITDANQLKDLIMNTYGKTGAIKLLGDSANQDRIIGITAEAALNKHQIVKGAINANSKTLGDKIKINQYYGTAQSLQNQADLLEKVFQAGGSIYSPDGEEITQAPTDRKTIENIQKWNNPNTNKKYTEKEAVTLVNPNPSDTRKERLFEFFKGAMLDGGGGSNPTDTITILQGNNNNVSIVGFSDKTSLADPQANTTMVKYFDNLMGIFHTLNDIDYEVDEESQKAAHSIIQKHQEVDRSLGENLKRATEAADTNLLKMIKKDKSILSLINDIGKNASGIKWVNGKLTGKSKYWIGDGKYDIFKKVTPSAFEKKDGSLTTDGESWIPALKNHGWTGKGEPTPEQKILALFDVPSTNLSADQNKTKNTILGNLSKHPTFKKKGLDAQLLNTLANIEDIKKKTMTNAQTVIERLNEFQVEDDEGNDFSLGDMAIANDMVENLHLYGAFKGRESSGLYSYGMINVIAGQDKANRELLQNCLGVSSKEELLKGIKTKVPQGNSNLKLKLSGVTYDESQISRNIPRDAQSHAQKDGKFLYIQQDESGKESYVSLDESILDKKQLSSQNLKPLGYITGRNIVMAFQDRSGEEWEVGFQTQRSKQGVFGKLDAIYNFGKDLQNCLRSHGAEKNESVSIDNLTADYMIKESKIKLDQHTVDVFGFIANELEKLSRKRS